MAYLQIANIMLSIAMLTLFIIERNRRMALNQLIQNIKEAADLSEDLSLKVEAAVADALDPESQESLAQSLAKQQAANTRTSIALDKLKAK